MSAIDKLVEKVQKLDNPIILGLDSRPNYIPDFIRQKYSGNMIGLSQAILEYNKIIIDSIYELVPAIKIQKAYFNMLGVYGADICKIICDYAKEKGLIVILDAKVGDVSHVSKAYSNAYIGRTNTGSDIEEIYDADFVTINAYYGKDTIEPFIQDCNIYQKGIFVVVKTGNETSSDFQKLKLENGDMLYEYVAKKVNDWGNETLKKDKYSNIGAIISLDTEEEYKKIRKIMPKTLIMIPNYSEKKQTAKIIKKAYNKDGSGVIVNVSKNALLAYKSEMWKGIYNKFEFTEALKAEITRIQREINRYRPRI